MKAFKILLISLLTTIFITSCGIKSDLYLPDENVSSQNK